YARRVTDRWLVNSVGTGGSQHVTSWTPPDVPTAPSDSAAIVSVRDPARRQRVGPRLLACDGLSATCLLTVLCALPCSPTEASRAVAARVSTSGTSPGNSPRSDTRCGCCPASPTPFSTTASHWTGSPAWTCTTTPTRS